MKAQITSCRDTKSKYGGSVVMLTFKMEDGKSARTWLDPKCGNYTRWSGIVTKARKGESIGVDGLNLKRGGSLVDADSFVKIAS